MHYAVDLNIPIDLKIELNPAGYFFDSLKVEMLFSAIGTFVWLWYLAANEWCLK